MFSSWKPVRSVDARVIRELFCFSFSLIVSGVLVTVVRYVYNVVIGHNFQRQDLGYYSQAFKFHQIPSNVVSGTVSGVAYPVLSSLNQNEPMQLAYFRKLIRVTAFCIFPVMAGLFVAFDNLVSIILTDKWLPIVPYFRILCVAAVLFPLHSMNVTLNTIKGFPKRSFAIEMARNVLVIVTLFFCLDSIVHMLVSFSLTYLAAYFISAFSVSRILPYGVMTQIKDIFPYAAISALMALIMYFVPSLGLNLYVTALLQLCIGGSFYCLALYLLGSKVFEEVLEVRRKSELKV
ncbi:MAG: oligosaccharide flippase family protein [Paludibacteraceae bacterium]|nr:oligosaccharide flippase family protein [Paludibacteraceae bacterium]